MSQQSCVSYTHTPSVVKIAAVFKRHDLALASFFCLVLAFVFQFSQKWSSCKY